MFDEVEGEAFDRGEVDRAVVFADTAGVVAEAHIQAPVQVVLDTPVPTDPLARTLGPDLRCSKAGTAVISLLLSFTTPCPSIKPLA